MSAGSDPLGRLIEGQGFIVLDGGLATELEARGADLNDTLWSAKLLLEDPDAIRRVHTSYLNAGADCIATATYQASFEGFARRGLGRVEAASLLELAVRLAVEARDEFWTGAGVDPVRRRPLVANSFGPYGAFLADGSEYRGDYRRSAAELRTFHEPRWRAVLDGGADLTAWETIPSAVEALVLRDLLVESPGETAWISFSCSDDLRICDGTPIADLARELDAVPNLAAIGVNCTAPAHVEGLVREIRAATDKPILVYPNSGGRYDATTKGWETPPEPTGWGSIIPRWRAAGAVGVGGCCRVRPREIERIRQTLSVG
ncbi:MAG: homocysteine S-methyltransferase [Gemmatimonadetes bacterium]|nr:homocysteine S-methyltransferase [Gemmatimonadota bacterium]